MVKLWYMGKSLENTDVYLAIFWVEMKDWREINPKEYEYDFTDQSERRQLGYMLMFKSLFNRQIDKALKQRAKELRRP